MNTATEQDIGHKSQEAIAPACRKFLMREIAVAIDGNVPVPPACLLPFTHQLWQILWVIFHISILNGDQIAAHQTKAGAQSHSFALVVFMAHVMIALKRLLLAQFL